jgi:L-lactate dehydrogenase (cytochrome)
MVELGIDPGDGGDMRAGSVMDFREMAKRRIPNIFFEYVDGGSYAEETLRRNVADFASIALRQLVMRDTTELDMSVTTLGLTYDMPVGLSPVGMSGMYRRRGEVQGARAAMAANVPMCLSTLGVCGVEEVTRGACPPWFQLYVLKDRSYTKDLLDRAKAAGSPVLLLTVDLPTPGARYRDVRSGFTGASGIGNALRIAFDGLRRPGWMWDVWLNGRPHSLGSIEKAVEASGGGEDYLGWVGANFDRSVTWKDVDWLRSMWDGPLVVKGVLDPEDAKDAVKAGFQGLVVSNHGGRQLDGVSSSIAALPRIAEAVGDDIELFMDGGVRSGLDVLKALSLGAKCCFMGRPWAYANAAGGQAAVSRMLDIVRAELQVAMILTGCTKVSDAGPHLLDRGAQAAP